MHAQVAEAVRVVQRRFGAGALRRGGDPLGEAGWPTGIPLLDRTLLPGGLPKGRVSVLAAAGGRGPSGRLTLLQALTASASRRAQVVYADLAGTLDPGFLADLGADLDSVLVVRPRDAGAADGLAMVRALAAAGVPWVAVALGERPRLGRPWDAAVSTLAEAAWRARSTVCVSAPAPLDRALAYASSLTLGCTPAGWQLSHGDVAGLRVEVSVAKSKVSTPGRRGQLLLRYPRPWTAAEVVAVPDVVAGAAVETPLADEPARVALAG